jgi:hypothetical protein
MTGASSIGGSSLITWLGNGNGTFKASTTTSLGSGARNLIRTDSNDDGVVDFAVGYTNGGIRTFLGNTLDFETETRINSLSGYTINVANLDSDGQADDIAQLVFDEGQYRLNVQTGNGNGTFKTTATLATIGVTDPSKARLVAAQLTDDNNTDLLLSTDTGVFLYAGNGDGTFAAAATYDTSLSNGGGTVLVGDTDRDGKMDVLAFSKNGDNTFTIKVRKSGTTTTEEPGESGTFNDVFGSGRSIKSRADALRLAADAKKLRATIRANMAALGKARDAISANMEFVRSSAAGLSAAQQSNALSGTRDAAALADKLRSYIVENVGAKSLKEVGNLEPIISATLLQNPPKNNGK